MAFPCMGYQEDARSALALQDKEQASSLEEDRGGDLYDELVDPVALLQELDMGDYIEVAPHAAPGALTNPLDMPGDRSRDSFRELACCSALDSALPCIDNVLPGSILMWEWNCNSLCEIVYLHK